MIRASAQTVWNVLVDLDGYSDWNPLLPQASGALAVGQQLHAIAALTPAIRVRINPRIMVVTPLEELRWRGRLPIPGLFSGEHYFCIEPGPNSHTRLIHGEVYNGLLRHVFQFVFGRSTRKAFDAMNVALRQRVESGNNQSS